MVNLYETLGVDSGVDSSELKRVYRNRVKKIHPDRNPDDPSAEEELKRVSEAYEILSDGQKRALYDRFGDIAIRAGFDPQVLRQYEDSASWLSELTQTAKKWKSRDSSSKSRAAHRSSRSAERAREAGRSAGKPEAGGPLGEREDASTQRRQKRAGARPRPEDTDAPKFDPKAIEDLLGGDTLRDILRAASDAAAEPGSDLEAEVVLELGEALRGCEQHISVRKPGGTRSLSVRIPPGIRDGGRMRLRGQGVSGRGGTQDGDLIVKVHVRTHPWFRREGDDLHLNLPVTIPEAIHGARVNIPTPEGQVVIRIPERTQGGSKLRLRGKGARGQNGPGDLIVHIDLRLPERNLRENLVDELEPLYAPDIRSDVTL
ncbi:MAG: DnaJ C-terminal domain-containing protein [Pseudomonadota bacterium]